MTDFSPREIASERAQAGAAALSDDARFHFTRRSDNFFFAGLLLLVAVFTAATASGTIVPAVMTWLLAEQLVRRMRLVLPGLLLVLLFALFVSNAVPLEWFGRKAFLYESIITPPLFSPIGYVVPEITIVRGFLVVLASLAFFARFRFPLALLPIAGGLVIAATAIAQLCLPAIDAGAMLLLCGLFVLAAAMAFDVTDPSRATRRADCAFALHLLAAPLIVHSLIPPAVGNGLQAMTGQMAAAIVGMVAILTLLAVVIDRRALLFSTLTYLGIVIVYAKKAAAVEPIQIFFATLLLLGAMVLILGVGWLPLRRGLMTLVPARIALRLPPVVVAA